MLAGAALTAFLLSAVATELEKQRLKEKYRETHPEVVRTDALIKDLRQKKDERASEEGAVHVDAHVGDGQVERLDRDAPAGPREE